MIELMRLFVLSIIEKFGLFILGGLIGAIVHRLRTKMSWRRFISTMLVSGFMGFCVGILLKNYIGAPEEVVFVACSLTGVFSNDILDQLKEIVGFLSEFVKALLKKKGSIK